MRADLEQHLRAVYPHGYLEAPDLTHHRPWDREAVTDALLQRLAPLGITVDMDQDPFDNERVVTLLLGFAAADGRVWMDRPASVNPARHWPPRLAETGQPALVCRLMLCSLFPAWQVHFSRWTEPAPDWTPAQHRQQTWTTLDEADLPAPWPEALAGVAACCAALGMERFSAAELAEEVPFVTRSVWLAEDDSDDLPEEEQAAFEARLGFSPSRQQTVCCLEDCLFWHYS